MSDKSKFAAAGATSPKVVVDRTYRARAEECSWAQARGRPPTMNTTTSSMLMGERCRAA